MKRNHDYVLNQHKVIKICIVGAGRAGEFHVKSLLTMKNFELLYIIDPDIHKANKLAYTANCAAGNSLDWVMVGMSFDAIIICTPTNTHYELIKKCLNYGKHVLCEKPLGKNIAEIKECFNLANSKNLKLLIAYQKRFDKNYSELYNVISTNNHLIKNINIINRDYPFPSLEYLKTSNGIVEDMICHDIDIINLYMGFKMPIKVTAYTHTFDENLNNINEIESIEILMQYSGGTIVHFSGSRKSSNGYDQRVEVYGDFGMYAMNNVSNNTLIRHDLGGSHNSEINYSFADRYSSAYKNELEYFYKMITDNLSSPIEEEHLILTKKICNAINESIRTNNTVYFSTNLREYQENSKQYFVYKEMHHNQTLEFVKNMKNKYSNLHTRNIKYNVKQVLQELNNFIDPSDPDVNEPNIIHAYQTAERIRTIHPLNKELQITGLIHDLGKILFKFNEPVWAIVGDTYVLGCEFPKTIIYYDTLKQNEEFNKHNKFGIYYEKCGLENLHLAYGHDEYLYQVLLENKSIHTLSEKYMNIIRYHSFYPWHTEDSYTHFMNDSDHVLLKDVKNFNKFDLYSKQDNYFISDEIIEYYNNLLDEYFPNDLFW